MGADTDGTRGQGAFVVAQWPEPRVQQWEILLKARAVENQAFVVAVNRVGTGPDDVFSGHSMVIDPLGNVVLQSKEHEEGIFTADINLEEVEKVRGQIPVLRIVARTCIIKERLCYLKNLTY